MLKITVCFSLLIWFQNEEKPLEKVLSAPLEGANDFVKMIWLGNSRKSWHLKKKFQNIISETLARL